MRSRNERSAHFCTVPARYDTDQARLFCFDVTRREILHEVCFQENVRPSVERWVKLQLFGEHVRSGLVGGFGQGRLVFTSAVRHGPRLPHRPTATKPQRPISHRYACLPLESVCRNRNHSCACAETGRSVPAGPLSPATCPRTRRCRRPPVAALSVRCSIA